MKVYVVINTDGNVHDVFPSEKDAENAITEALALEGLCEDDIAVYREDWLIEGPYEVNT